MTARIREGLGSGALLVAVASFSTAAIAHHSAAQFDFAQTVRIEGVDRILHPTSRMAHPGPVRVAFGAPLRLSGEDYATLAAQVEAAVRSL